jgi:hypothetical protein
MMPADFIAADRISPATTGEGSNELLRTRLELMRQLEASLQRSRKALLALDLAGIERGTGEQVNLVQEFESVLRRSTAPPAIGRQSAEEGGLGLPVHASELARELRRSENRIREAARLQAALLARARSKLRVLANMLAGPSVTYGPLPARSGGAPRVFAWKEGGESNPCRV